MNILVMKKMKLDASKPQRTKEGFVGLNDDKIFLARFLGLSSTRSAYRTRKLTDLSFKAAAGDKKSAKSLLEHMTRGKDSDL